MNQLGPWLRYLTLAAVFTVAGCNIFNPNGEGDASSDPRAEGEEFFRRGQYAKAMESFELAIKQDSANSLAYYGYAKAAVRFYELDNVGILNDLDSTADENNDSGRIFFEKLDDAALMTRRLNGSTAVRRILEILRDRDSLTLSYSYLTDSSDAAQEDPDFAARRAYIMDYLVKADLGIPGYRTRAQFPLTDNRMPFSKVRLDFSILLTLNTFSKPYDFDRNGIIDFNTRDSIYLKMKPNSSGSFGNLAELAGDLETDTALAQNLNALLADMNGDLGALSGILGQLAPEGDSGSEEGSSEAINSFITGMGDAVLFYQFGDKLDNDGDGCIDEEILDEKDNDLDGFVDEDARVIPADKPDGVDNDRNGKTDPYFFPTNTNVATVDSAEGPVGATVYPSRPHVLGFVRKYLASNNLGQSELGFQDDRSTTWIAIDAKKDEANMPLRIAIQKDSLAVKVARNNGVVPDSLVAKIQNAKNIVGGCWRNY